ncbi:MAG: HAD hydrolase-like protein, partial [Oscillospiraceae bacterium]|nr:HAD hydrolase-like protein [Oscillospiraceae bacterium]
MREQLVIFDLDGTILDTLEDLYLSVNHTLRKNALPERTMEEVRCFVGNGIRKLIERAVPEGSGEALIDQVHADFTAYYEVHCADHTKPYEGIPELIRSLRAAGLKTAV